MLGEPDLVHQQLDIGMVRQDEPEGLGQPVTARRDRQDRRVGAGDEHAGLVQPLAKRHEGVDQRLAAERCANDRDGQPRPRAEVVRVADHPDDGDASSGENPGRLEAGDAVETDDDRRRAVGRDPARCPDQPGPTSSSSAIASLVPTRSKM